jgi:GT2 family glycosyltransferase
MKTAVVTVVHGRADHLRRQLDGTGRSTRIPHLHVVVAVDDPGITEVVSFSGWPAEVLHFDGGDGPLPMAEARNAGALAATDSGADLLVFLDVDCIPGRTLISRYHDVASGCEHRDALLCGAVTYLPPPGPGGYAANLDDVADPHPARPTPAEGEVIEAVDYDLFWSLSFALTASTWRRIGGFCNEYRGYGAEDTDFGQTAAAAGVPMRWVGGAHAFHQYHPVSDPPVEHLHDIVRNAAIFYERWGRWPMESWLNAFHDRGLITHAADGRPVVARRTPRS